jgi:RNA polymerase-binding transcription factor DksA
VTDASADSPTPQHDLVRDVPGASPTPDVDLDEIERDLEAVERALDRLSEGTYWTDEVTGQPIPDDVLVNDPTARRA